MLRCRRDDGAPVAALTLDSVSQRRDGGFIGDCVGPDFSRAILAAVLGIANTRLHVKRSTLLVYELERYLGALPFGCQSLRCGLKRFLQVCARRGGQAYVVEQLEVLHLGACLGQQLGILIGDGNLVADHLQCGLITLIESPNDVGLYLQDADHQPAHLDRYRQRGGGQPTPRVGAGTDATSDGALGRICDALRLSRLRCHAYRPLAYRLAVGVGDHAASLHHVPEVVRRGSGVELVFCLIY